MTTAAPEGLRQPLEEALVDHADVDVEAREADAGAGEMQTNAAIQPRLAEVLQRPDVD